MTDIAQAITASNLPLVPHLPAVCTALEKNGTVILRADPGSGKSTLVPLALLDYFGGKIIMLEPRRAAVLGIASRLADLLGENVGERAGYAVRLERKVSARTQIEVITEGLLVRRMQENPALFTGGKGPLTIIFDEFHERSIHTDLAFAFALDLRRMGADIRIVIMSATLDTAKAAACIEQAGGKAAIMECPGRVFPVEIIYHPIASNQDALPSALVDILHNKSNETSGDILVFLPGRREINVCAGRLRERGFARDFEIEILHGSLPLADQRRIISPAKNQSRRRVILSTNVAETGLTIPGITLVIDSGSVRLQRFHIPSGMNRLSLEAASVNSVEQRAGRAGRLGPGRCIRLWGKDEWRPQETPAEIIRIDIAAAVLECLIWGAGDANALLWSEPPPQPAWDSALELLRQLEAIDSDKRPRETGKHIARLGLDPRLGRLCIAGRDMALAPLACAAAALLAERDSSGLDNDPDFTPRLSAFRANAAWTGRARDSAQDLLRRLGLSLPLQWNTQDEANAGELLVTAFPDRIAKRAEGEGIFRFPSGREARIKAPFVNQQWLCALEVDSGERSGFIRLALPLSEETALAALEKQAVIEKNIKWNKLIPRLIETKKAGRLTLTEQQRPCHRDELLPFLSAMLWEHGLSALPWDDAKGAPRRLLERIRFFVNHINSQVNNTDVNHLISMVNDNSLIDRAAEWLGPYIWGGAGSGKGEIIDANSLCDALNDLLGWERKREMDKLVPDLFALPSGRKCLINYGSGEPFVRLRLQDAFGINGACAVMGIPIVFELLSPANRPIQTTRDLPGFWSGSYAEVRKEMRGRYPKHHWPEVT